MCRARAAPPLPVCKNRAREQKDLKAGQDAVSFIRSTRSRWSIHPIASLPTCPFHFKSSFPWTHKCPALAAVSGEARSIAE